jgi:hypothetical protein
MQLDKINGLTPDDSLKLNEIENSFRYAKIIYYLVSYPNIKIIEHVHYWYHYHADVPNYMLLDAENSDSDSLKFVTDSL